jgi:hypothetical protein
MSHEVLDRRALNRATLSRQHLLDRAEMTTLQTIEHLVGLQGQAPDAPYVGLWTRLSGFHTNELAELIADRRAVRISLMRATVHLVSAHDALALRPLVQGVLERSFASQHYARNLAGLEIAELLAAGRALMDQQPRTRSELGQLLAERWPERDPASMAYAVSYLVPAIQVPPRAIWGSRGPARLASVEAWLHASVDQRSSVDDLVVRYLGAYGPATVKDAQRWCGLTRLGEVFERLGSRLRRFRGEDGAELFDLHDAPRPDRDTPAPVRFLPEYDNVLLSHDDRRRVIPDGHPVPLPAGNGARMGTVLIDGEFRATWKITTKVDSATVRIDTFAPVPSPDAIEREAEQLLAFAVAGATKHEIQLS